MPTRRPTTSITEANTTNALLFLHSVFPTCFTSYCILQCHLSIYLSLFIYIFLVQFRIIATWTSVVLQIHFVPSDHFCLHPLFHQNITSSSLPQDIYLHLSFPLTISTLSISTQLFAYLFTSISHSPLISTNSDFSSTLPWSICFRAVALASMCLNG